MLSVHGVKAAYAYTAVYRKGFVASVITVTPAAVTFVPNTCVLAGYTCCCNICTQHMRGGYTSCTCPVRVEVMPINNTTRTLICAVMLHLEYPCIACFGCLFLCLLLLRPRPRLRLRLLLLLCKYEVRKRPQHPVDCVVALRLSPIIQQ